MGSEEQLGQMDLGSTYDLESINVAKEQYRNERGKKNRRVAGSSVLALATMVDLTFNQAEVVRSLS